MLLKPQAMNFSDQGSQPEVSAPPGVSDSFPESSTKIRNLVPRNVCRRYEFRSTTIGVSAIN